MNATNDVIMSPMRETGSRTKMEIFEEQLIEEELQSQSSLPKIEN